MLFKHFLCRLDWRGGLEERVHYLATDFFLAVDVANLMLVVVGEQDPELG